jgi:Tol biopolymer transport system component
VISALRQKCTEDTTLRAFVDALSPEQLEFEGTVEDDPRQRVPIPMSRRTLIAIAAAAAIAVAAIGAGVHSLMRERSPAAGTGDVIAYSCKERKNVWYAVCVMNTDGSGKQRLTTGLTTTDPAWSPDGRQIAFTRNEDVGEFTTFTDDDVFVMNADGDNVRQLTPEVDGNSSGQPSWSPDGRTIVYVRGPSIASAVVSATPLAFGELVRVPADGGAGKRLTRGEPDGAPAWSPDGREIVFVRGRDLNKASGDMDLFVLDAAGGTPRRLTNTPHSLETAPAWSPDGTRIAFARSYLNSAYTGEATIFVINRDGSGESLVLRHKLFSETSYGLSWSPDGRSIVLETGELDCTVVATVRIASPGLRRLTSCTGPFRAAVGPSWQPDAVSGAAG